jgi:hypothetical protein
MKIRHVMGCAALAAALCLSQAALAQRGPPGPPPPPKPAQQAAPIDLTGYWVSVVTEEWRWRMLTPPHGDYASVPLNPMGKKVADTWTTAEDGSCKAYGAAGLMRMPTRVHITWADSNTLKLETDWGEQTRMFHFVPNRPYGVNAMGVDVGQPAMMARGANGSEQGAASLQGNSVAVWELPYAIDANVGLRGPQRAGGFGPPSAPEPGGSLEVFTGNLAPGWLRRNGVPYGEHTQLTEYYQTFTDPVGKQWFDVTTKVVDPEYLMAPFITSSDFRSEPNDSAWAPHPCKSAS